ncbi:MAG: toxic anion resistance protein [Lachnospiraceae bacterium]|nr:toxic anion resistance protein [Lachnospiraceae bacterium]
MSEVIDAQVVDLKEESTATQDPFMDLMSAPKPAEIVEAKEDDLSPEEQAQVEKFMSQIDIRNSQLVLQYGAAAQKNVADFSEGALKSVRTKDMGEIGNMLTGVVTELKGFSVEEQKGGFLGLFKKTSNQLTSLKAKYDKAEVNVNKISKAMEGHQQVLLKDVAMLDKMYDENLDYFKQLSLYIIAGKKKLEEAKTKELPTLLQKAEESGLQEDSQAARDYASMIERFEKKIYDLELTRNISMQMAPQIRLIQSNDTVMAEKIQSTLVNTIPLWKSQMVIAIGLDHSQDAARAQREVTDMTNELLKKNAEALKIASVESARESERGIVDIETLTTTNQMLIETFDEVMQIQADGRAKRQAAEAELGRIETEMKDKILQISRESLKVE